MNPTEPTITPEQDEQRSRRAKLVRFGFAGFAVLGIGAAITSAAWTDDAWFAGGASAVEKVELQASLDGATWFDADVEGDAVQIPVTEFGDLNQGANEQVTLHLKNDSSVPLTLGAGTVTVDEGADSIFGGAAPATATVTAPADTVLESEETTTATLTVTTPADWPVDYQGKTGSLTVKFTGES